MPKFDPKTSSKSPENLEHLSIVVNKDTDDFTVSLERKIEQKAFEKRF